MSVEGVARFRALHGPRDGVLLLANVWDALSARLIARTDDIDALAAGVREGLSILEGWRYEQFGRDAVDLVEGRMAFAVRNGRLKMTRTE